MQGHCVVQKEHIEKEYAEDSKNKEEATTRWVQGTKERKLEKEKRGSESWGSK